MGVGHRRLAPLWALALTLACAQHTGKVPAGIPRPAVTGAWSPCHPQVLGWSRCPACSKQLGGLARGSEKLRVSVGRFSCPVPAPGACGVREALLGLRGPGGGQGGVSRASVSFRLQGAILRGLSHQGRHLPACFPGHSWAPDVCRGCWAPSTRQPGDHTVRLRCPCPRRLVHPGAQPPAAARLPRNQEPACSAQAEAALLGAPWTHLRDKSRFLGRPLDLLRQSRGAACPASAELS